MDTARFMPLPTSQPMLPLTTAGDARLMALPSAEPKLFRLPTGFKPLADAGPVAENGKDPVRQAAEDLVSISLLQPLLKQSHQDPFKSELFHGGQGEQMFTQQLDDEMAKRMSQRMSSPIVEAIYRKFKGMSPDDSALLRGVKAQPSLSPAMNGAPAVGMGVDRHG